MKHFKTEEKRSHFVCQVASDVRVVKAAFATPRLAAKPQETGRLVQLLFDSFSQPALAGTRSAATRIRQMLYRAEPYQIDLQIELRQERNSLVVTGQLLDVSHPEVTGRDVRLTQSVWRVSRGGRKLRRFAAFLPWPRRKTRRHFAPRCLGFIVLSGKNDWQGFGSHPNSIK